MSRDVSLFNRFWNDVPSELSSRGTFFPDAFGREFDQVLSGRSDFEEFDDRYEITIEVPGVQKKEIDIELAAERLTVSWKREREDRKGKGKNTRYERQSGSFVRSFHVDGVEQGKIEAELKNGVLSITAKKAQSAQAKRIAIS